MALKSPSSDVRGVSPGVNIAKEGCEKTFQRSLLQPGRREWKDQGILVLRRLPAGSVLSCWWGTEVSLRL